ncbi:MAG TPA: alpha/beta fold hydrolase [Kiritimatiellia bacterium]|nr:alpha/beta fold hydrolase [Kiritimatiellia bacterium]HMO99574.1 alpha/beta fold hydrolase [Kiritimatiellia bacterium]HMP97551.1 alpha/beta fold hydrolase [Kiritimatiellia bacterium]
MLPVLPLALAGGAVYGGVRWFEWRNTFKPSRTMEGDPGQIGLEFEEVLFFAEDGCRLYGWWLPHPEARGTILYCHGNAGNISGRLEVCAGLHRLGVHVFVFDYRGYGLSRGVPGEEGLYRDARAAYEVVRARYADADDPPVIAYGASLGGAVAAHLAIERSLRGLIIEGGFTSAIDVGERWYPWLPVRALARYRFDARSKVMALSAPKLFAHSTRDRIIPFDLGGQLFSAAAFPKTFVSLDGEHGEAGWLDTPHYHAELQHFVSGVLGQPSPSIPPG